MNEMNMFEVALRGKYRFPTRVGLVTAEDLFDMSLKQLDATFKTLNSAVNIAKEESLLEVKSEADAILDVQIEIIKYVVKSKQEANKARVEAKGNKEKKEYLMSILKEKENAEVLDKSPEEIKAMIDAL